MGRKLLLVLGFTLLGAACGGGGESAKATTAETSIEDPGSTVALDFDVPETAPSSETVPSTTPTTTVSGSLFEGFSPEEVDQSEMIVELDSPDVAKVADETVFALDTPVACREVPIGSDVEVKQVIFDLHWSCFYRPKVVNDNDDWLLGLDEGRYTRSELRDKVAGETRESDCMRGGSCDGIIIPSDLGENVRVECNFDSVAVPHERAQIRIQHICGNNLDVTIVSE